MIRRGFTLTEVLISLTILSVVSIGMVMTLSFAVRTFRAGEYSRAANDEAVTILASLESDLDRMLPAPLPVVGANGTLTRPDTGGWLYAKVLNYGTANDKRSNGSCLVAFTTKNPDRTQITATGEYANVVVAWWTDKNGNLKRVSKPLPGGAGNTTCFDWIKAFTPDGPPSSEPVFAQNANNQNVRATFTDVASGCMHFGAWVATQESISFSRPLADLSDTTVTPGPDWEAAKPGPQNAPPERATVLPPHTQHPDNAVDTSLGGTYPSALRISLILAGPSRFKPQGTLRTEIGETDTDSTAKPRIVGLDPMPAVNSYVWISNGVINDPTIPLDYGDGEWLKVERTSGNMLMEYKRFRLRSGPYSNTAGQPHPVGSTVAFGRPWSLVRIIPK
jgi:prepilin-type N-terminal cleavage/methylation domain-containing protein